ncbi:glucuronate isomerase [Bifidobacterium sp. 82T10]|uniref:Glucuronate isomerase n=1 Tax=Bifidobacterium miconis TaxID=2834435 RepID=A0ABS6WH87_9BIFI|nr:glucuronate isomerase [Bifidobacterium miconis]MBW3093393.1 glucuronate isomerase [Bifidobacterium miconis]
MTQSKPLDSYDDRLLPADPTTRSIAHDLYDLVRNAPIISPHGHVPVEWFAENRHFANPTELFITPDHYVTRLLHAQGVPLSALGVNQKHFTDEQAREAFLLLGHYWPAYAGTPMRYWFEDSLRNVFGITEAFNEESAGRIYDQLNEMLQTDEYGTRSLVKRFNIGFISTTDDPADDLAVNDQVRADKDFPARLAPAFRPDRYLEPAREDWPDLVRKLGDAAGVDATSYAGYVEAMRRRRVFFKEHGAVLSDHSHMDVRSDRLSDYEANRLFKQGMDRTISAADATRLRRHLFSDQVRLAQEDGLVLTVHPAVHRSYDPQGLADYGMDIGADIPAKCDFAVDLKPILNAYGNNPDFHFVAFTMDDTTFTRELAPLAGYYPAMYVGAPWWFLDQPVQITRYLGDVVPICGFTKLSGFIDDTRALCSIPARHDMNRRLTSSYVAGLVATHQIDFETGAQIVKDSVDAQPKRVFKL